MKRLLNHMRLQSLLTSNTAVTRMATVKSYDPDNYCCKVLLQPEEVESGWLPISSPWVGSEWGIFAPPSEDDLVIVVFQESDIDSGIVTGRLYNDENRPVRAESGVFYLIHQSESCLKFNNDGSVDMLVAEDLRVDVRGNATATVGGNLSATVEGDTSIETTGHTTIKSDGAVDIDGGSGDLSGVVTQMCKCSYTGMPHADASTNVKASKG